MNEEIQLYFYYEALDTSTATTLQTYAGEIKVFMTKTLENIIEVGKRLKEAQELLRYSENGGFRAWIKTEFDWSRKTAYNFINVYDTFGECVTVTHSEGLAKVPLKALYMLAAPSTPEPVRQEVVERAEAGETITFTEAKKIIQQVKVKQMKVKEKKEKVQQRQQENMAVLQREITQAPVLYEMDCLEFLQTIPDQSVDLLFTDPPYSTDVLDIAEFASWWVLPALAKVKPSGRAFICIGAYAKEIKAYLDILETSDFILDAPLVWTDRNTLGNTPKMKYKLNYQFILHLYTTESRPLDTSIIKEMFSVQDITAPDGRQGNRFHTWQKPDELAVRLIRHTTQENDCILDCFACTGTFSLLAAKMRRTAIGCDNSKERLQIAERRGCNVIYQ